MFALPFRPYRFILTLGLALGLTQTPAARADTQGAVPVGADACVAALGCRIVGPAEASGFCSHTTVNALLTAHPSTVEVRIVGASMVGAQPLHLDNITLSNRGLRMIGGYATCTDAANGNLIDLSEFNPRTLVRSPFNVGPILLAEQTVSTGSELLVDLWYLQIDGATGGSGRTGGIRVDVADSSQVAVPRLTVRLNHTWVTNNRSSLGGGINLLRGRLELANAGVIQGNTATSSGGGIWCQNGSVEQISSAQFFQSAVLFNVANANFGGGLFLDNCPLSWRGGLNGFDEQIGVNGNLARRGGGGIYATGGDSILTLGTDTNNFVLFKNNGVNSSLLLADEPSSSGGGAILAENGASVDVYRAVFDGNQAGRNSYATINTGGAIRTNNATLNLAIPSNAQCNPIVGCIVLRNNFSKGSGAAVFVNGGSTLIDGASINNNQAGDGAIVHFNSSGSKLISNSFIINNYLNLASPSSRHAVTVSGGSATISGSTIADNRLAAFSGPSSIINVETGSVELRASILYELDAALSNLPAVITDSGPGSVFGACLSTHDSNNFTTANFPNITNVIYTPSPLFINAPSGNYHLVSDQSNFVIDYCSVANASPSSFALSSIDFDYDPRVTDLPSIANIGGPVDIGADEAAANTVDAIFSNGFE